MEKERGKYAVRWTWRPGAQVVVAELNLLTARERVEVDGALVVDRRGLSIASEHAVPLREGKVAKLRIGSEGGFGVACTLELDGSQLPPSSVEGDGIRAMRSLVVGVLVVIGVAAAATLVATGFAP